MAWQDADFNYLKIKKKIDKKQQKFGKKPKIRYILEHPGLAQWRYYRIILSILTKYLNSVSLLLAY